MAFDRNEPKNQLDQNEWMELYNAMKNPGFMANLIWDSIEKNALGMANRDATGRVMGAAAGPPPAFDNVWAFMDSNQDG